MKIHLIDQSTIQVEGEDILLGDLAITQGLSYYQTFYIKGNYRSWIPKAHLLTSYIDQGGVKEAEFSFQGRVYNMQEQVTFITMYLKASDTKELISTVYQAKPGQVPSEENCFLYNVVLINPEDDDDIYPLIDTSFVQVKPGVTI